MTSCQTIVAVVVRINTPLSVILQRGRITLRQRGAKDWGPTHAGSIGRMIIHKDPEATPDPMHPDLVSFARQASAAPSLGALFGIADATCERLGANAISLAFVTGLGPATRFIGFMATLDEAFTSEYRARGLHLIDPSVAHIIRRGGSKLFGVAGAGSASARGNEALSRTAEAGYLNQYVVTSTPAGSGISAALGVLTPLPADAAISFFAERGPLLDAIGDIVALRSMALLVQSDLPDDFVRLDRALLTPRETEVLRYLADGLRAEEIAARMAIRPVTVHVHIASIKTKLEARTREQAVAKAIRERII
jgi:DNA-binding CsgD family transcriptional regulator